MSKYHKLWRYLHTSVSLPEDYAKWRRGAQNFLGSECFAGLEEYEKEHPLDFSSRETVFEWSVNLHNHVNQKLGKPLMPLEEAKKLYHKPKVQKQQCPKCGKEVPYLGKIIRCVCGYDNEYELQLKLNCPKTPEDTPWIKIHRYAIGKEDWNTREAKTFVNTTKPNLEIDCTSFQSYTKSAWAAHNLDSAKKNQPQVTFADYLATYHDTVYPTRPNLLITVATGYFLSFYEIVKPSLVAYADKINADLICLMAPKHSWWGYEKFRVQTFVPYYERTLYVDSDLVITPNCPNLFEMVPYEDIGIHDDYPWAPVVDWIYPEKEMVCQSQDIYPLLAPVMYNTGVVVCNKHHRAWEAPKRPLPENFHCAEQFYVEQTILREGYTITKLPIELNTQWWMKEFLRLLPSAQIVHLANSLCKHQDLTLAMREFFYRYSTNRVPNLEYITSRFP